MKQKVLKSELDRRAGTRLSNSQRIRYSSFVRRFSSCHALVVGDLMLDVFIWGKVERISPEAPVPIVEVCWETKCLGGSANVANNIAALGGKVSVAGVVGTDSAGEELLSLLRESAISCEALVTEAERPTTVKTRIIAKGQQVVRVDREVRKVIGTHLVEQILKGIEAIQDSLDCVVISDYAKGVITPQLVDYLRSLSQTKKIPILADPTVNNHSLFRNLTAITPNRKEASLMSSIPIKDEESLYKAGMNLLSSLGCENILITQGKDGMTLFTRDRNPMHIPALAREVYDVTGAGDTVIATLALAMASGMTCREAAVLANIAAGMVVGEVGTATVSTQQLLKALEDHQPI